MATKIRGGVAIKPNHGGQIPRYIISVDTESLPVMIGADNSIKSHEFRLGVAISVRIVDDIPVSEKVLRFTDKQAFIDFLVSISNARYTVWIVGHNILFDFILLGFSNLFVTSELVPDFPRNRRSESIRDGRKPKTYGLCCIDSPPTIISARVRSTGGRLVFVDSLNWFPYPLSELGEAIGRAKMTMPKFTEPDDVWFAYCENDTRIVLEAFCGLIKWVKENNLGVFRYTAAAQSMSSFRHKWMRHKIYLHDEQQVKLIERNCYFGGRSEVFRKCEISEIIHKYDVSSLFPSVMESGKYPYTLESCEFRDEYTDVPPDGCFSECIAEVMLETNCPVYPVRSDGLTIYPIGKFGTTLAGPELSSAALLGHIIGIKSWSHYKVADLFSDFVLDLWDMRMRNEASGNKLYAAFCKRLLNSLHGKFGELSPVWQFDINEVVAIPWSKWCNHDMQSGDISEYRSFGWYAQKNCGRQEKHNTFCAISSFVTSYARIRMNELRLLAGRQNVYYQGVDSLIITNTGKANLTEHHEIRERELGYLRHEYTTSFGEIRGVGDYTLGNKTVIAGKPSNCAQDEYGDFIQRQFLSKSRLFDDEAITTVNEVAKKWKSRNRYRKGIVGQDGWVEPFTVNPPTNDTTSTGSLEDTINSASALTRSINVMA